MTEAPPPPLSLTPAPAPTGDDPLRQRAEEILQAVVGHEQARLRPDQWRAIEALVVHARRCLVVQRTGWGKSAVYFVSTALLREGWGGWHPGRPVPARRDHDHQLPPAVGPTIIISPLLALMRDQIAAADKAGIRAVTMNSANTTQWQEVEAVLAAGEADVLLVSPERLNNPAFRDDVLPHLATSAGLVVIDEAHCVSDWGHDFRPDYRRIRTLLDELSPRTPVLATTATANARVSQDVAEQLAGGTDGAGTPEVLVLRGELDRPSLHLGVHHEPDAASRLAWLTAYLRAVPGSGIVYCLTVSAAQAVTEHLRHAGLHVAAYTGQTEPAEREELEEALKANAVKALIATSALGMGFDKPDLGFVVHVGAPQSPVAYYQQVGRAGRGVERAEVVLLPGSEDQAIWRWFGEQGFPPEPEVRTVLEALSTAAGQGQAALSTPALESVCGLRRSRLDTMLKVLDVEGAVRRVRGGWSSTGAHWDYDADRYSRVQAAREREAALMLDYEALAAPSCRMAFLRTVLDDPEMVEGWRCGRCDLCGGLRLTAATAAADLEAAHRALAQVGAEITPRRQWPTGMDRLGLANLRGRIPEPERASLGLTVGRLDGLGLATHLRALIDAGTDTEVPQLLREAVVDVAEQLAGLIEVTQAEPEGTLGCVVLIDSRTRPRLVRSLAQAVARVLPAQPVGAVSVRGPVTRHDVASAFRLRDVAASLSIDGWSAQQRAAIADRAVVLVDDWTDSGWTMTVAARLLLQAGAASVHPLTLAQR